MTNFLNILFTKDPGRKVAIGSITLDATVEEKHELSATVTDHPIEQGGFVTDHVYENPRKLSITGEITESPVLFFSVLGGLSNRRIEAFDQLNALFDLKERVTIVTGLKIYTDMVIESLSFPRNQETGQRLQFTAELKETRFVASEIVGVAEEKISPSKRDKVVGNKDVGTQETIEANDSQSEKSTETKENLNKSAAAKIADIF